MTEGKQNSDTHTLVVCIGNSLAADDGVGNAVFNHLRTRALPDRVRLLELGVGGIDLIDHFQGEDRLIVVDAVQLGGMPGTVHLFDWEQLPVRTMRAVSGHGIGIREAIEVCRRLQPDILPEEIFLVGIEGACFDQLQAQLSKEVERAVPEAADMVISLVSPKP